jgi:uncharacterized membrane protein YkoI
MRVVDARGPVSLLAVALVLVWAVAWASDDHERARAAREAGKIMSLQAILERVRAEFTGSVLEVELEEEDGGWIYKVELLAPGGAKVEVEYDARDGRRLRVKQQTR